MKEGVNYRVFIDSEGEMAIHPPMADIFRGLRVAINEFIDTIDKFDYKIIRVEKFNFIVRNVIKPH